MRGLGLAVSSRSHLCICLRIGPAPGAWVTNKTSSLAALKKKKKTVSGDFLRDDQSPGRHSHSFRSPLHPTREAQARGADGRLRGVHCAPRGHGRPRAFLLEHLLLFSGAPPGSGRGRGGVAPRVNDPWRVERRRSVWREAVPGDLSESESAKVDVATDRFGEMHPRSFYLPKMKVTSCLWAKQSFPPPACQLKDAKSSSTVYGPSKEQKREVTGLWSACSEHRERRITATLSGQVGTGTRGSDVPPRCGRFGFQASGQQPGTCSSDDAQSSARGSPPGFKTLRRAVRRSLWELGLWELDGVEHHGRVGRGFHPLCRGRRGGRGRFRE